MYIQYTVYIVHVHLTYYLSNLSIIIVTCLAFISKVAYSSPTYMYMYHWDHRLDSSFNHTRQLHVLMRDVKEGRKKQARSNKQQLRQSNSWLGPNLTSYMYMYVCVCCIVHVHVHVHVFK